MYGYFCTCHMFHMYQGIFMCNCGYFPSIITVLNYKTVLFLSVGTVNLHGSKSHTEC